MFENVAKRSAGDKLSLLDLTHGNLMQTYTIHEAKTQLSRLVDQAARGGSFVIAKAGKPMVKVIALDAATPGEMRRFGFMAGQITIPADFNTMGAAEIEALFEGRK